MPHIDFAAARREIPIRRVLDLLHFRAVERRGDQLRGPCPLHGSARKNSRSFSVNLTKNAFRCFVCHAAGNQLDLWAGVSKLPVFDATVDLCGRLGIDVPFAVHGPHNA
jgi:DNA primase